MVLPEGSGPAARLETDPAVDGWAHLRPGRASVRALVKRHSTRRRHCVAAGEEADRIMHGGYRKRADARIRKAGLPPRQSVSAYVDTSVGARSYQREGETEDADIPAFHALHGCPRNPAVPACQGAGSAGACKYQSSLVGVECDRQQAGRSAVHHLPGGSPVCAPGEGTSTRARHDHLVVAGAHAKGEDRRAALLRG